MWFVIYWIICGLIVFGLTNPTVEVFYFKSSNIVEFIASMLLGGIIIPILLIAGMVDIIKILFLKEKE